MKLFTSFDPPEPVLLKLILGLAFVTICFFANGQTTGDYRSALGFFETGSWNDVNDWERWDGSAWAAPGANGYPGQNSVPETVTIISLDIMQLNVSPANNIGNLVIEDISSLTTSGNQTITIDNNLDLGASIFTFGGTGNLTVSGTSQMDGLFTDNNNSGVSTFVGLVNNTGTWTSTTVTTTGNLVFRGGITNSGTFNAGGATFNTNDQTLSGTLSFANTVTVTGVTVTNNGTVSMSNTAAGTLTGVGGTWSQGVNSTINYAGSTLATLILDASNIGNTVNYNGTAAAGQTVYNSSSATYHHLTLSGTGNRTKTLSANTIVNGNLNIQNTAIFSVSTFSLSVAGNWTNSSTNTDPFVQGTQTVTFNGTTAAQAISNTGDADGTVFNSITLNNTFPTAPQFTFSNTVTANVGLNMQSGIIDLNATTFTLGVNATTASTLNRTASTTTNWMYNGSFRRFWVTATAVSSSAGNLYGLFPVGSSTASSYRPVEINSTVSPTTGGSFTVTHTHVDGSTDLSPFYDDAGTNIVRKNNAQFVTAISGVVGGAYDIGATMTGLDPGTLTDIRLAVSTGATTASAVGTHQAATGTAPNPTARRTGITTLADFNNDFRISTINSAATPLPVELLYFSATVRNDVVDLKWSTASELNNDFFTIERASNIENFEIVGTPIKGRGTTNERNEYVAVDGTPLYGRSYYRLKQTDFDGKFTYSDVQVVDYDGPKFASLKAYPNPSDGHSLTVLVTGLKDQAAVPIQIYNVQGQLVYQGKLDVDTPGTLKHEIEFGSPLRAGVYLIKAGPTLQLTQKIFIH